MFAAGTTVAEPASGETVWSNTSAYNVNNKVIRTETHRVYECVQAVPSGGRATLPENDPTYWLDKGPTQRYAPFDSYTSTAATGTTSMTYVLKPGFFNAIALYGLVGLSLSISVKDATGGTVIYSKTIDLTEPSIGWYEYLFSPRKPINKVILKGIPIRPTAELTVTITASSGQPVAIGMMNIGDYAALSETWGGTQFGASAEPTSNSYFKNNSDGTTAIVKRPSATNMRASVMIPKGEADQALYKVQSVLDVPVSWIASDVSGFAGLNVFGLGSASLSYDSPSYATMNISVRGYI